MLWHQYRGNVICEGIAFSENNVCHSGQRSLVTDEFRNRVQTKSCQENHKDSCSIVCFAFIRVFFFPFLSIRSVFISLNSF